MVRQIQNLNYVSYESYLDDISEEEFLILHGVCWQLFLETSEFLLCQVFKEALYGGLQSDWNKECVDYDEQELLI